MFFLLGLITLLESTVTFLLSFGQNALAVVLVMVFFIVWGVSWLPVAAILAITLHWQPDKPLPPEQKLPILVSLYLLAPPIVWGMSWLTHEHLSDYGIVWDISILGSLGIGFGFGILSLAFVFIGQTWLRYCSFQVSNLKQVGPIFLPILFIALFVGGIEELVFRGFLFTALNHDYPTWAAAAVSSVVFAVLHLVWEQRETIPQLPGLWLMGMVLVLARLVDGGNLGLAWGLHAGWIWAIACIDTTQLLTYTGQVSEWVTGKNQKPLAGVAGIVCLLLTAVVLRMFLES